MTDVRGREFDWFCTDQKGRIALVATGGEGPVPPEALASMDVHDALGSHIEVAHWGTSEVWLSYSAAGLYVYDWDDSRRAYVRIATPTAPVSVDLAASMRSAAGIPKLNADFERDASIDVA
ncbi:hypothetical protein [Ralstonia wenshanensis]|uniref:Uncharacterized protein n=1 Tax=Ralstonia wenshanensis TaxID=2842456 RepID=A0AAD2BDN7_9RALS|nr:hypothetical protein [Ralstonia wenshanensis]CAJ0705435.1 hypothetical protein LMG18091_04438 [Ralstonia wenshanensis]